MTAERRCSPWRGRKPYNGVSAVLRGVRGVRDGQTVEVVLGDGRTVVGRAEWLDDGVIRVRLPDDAR